MGAQCCDSSDSRDICSTSWKSVRLVYAMALKNFNKILRYLVCNVSENDTLTFDVIFDKIF